MTVECRARERRERDTMVGEEKRHQMMQNLFGDQSEEEEEEEEVESEHESNRQPDYASVRSSPLSSLNKLRCLYFSLSEKNWCIDIIARNP